MDPQRAIPILNVKVFPLMTLLLKISTCQRLRTRNNRLFLIIVNQIFYWIMIIS